MAFWKITALLLLSPALCNAASVLLIVGAENRNQKAWETSNPPQFATGRSVTAEGVAVDRSALGGSAFLFSSAASIDNGRSFQLLTTRQVRTPASNSSGFPSFNLGRELFSDASVTVTGTATRDTTLNLMSLIDGFFVYSRATPAEASASVEVTISSLDDRNKRESLTVTQILGATPLLPETETQEFLISANSSLSLNAGERFRIAYGADLLQPSGYGTLNSTSTTRFALSSDGPADVIFDDPSFSLPETLVPIPLPATIWLLVGACAVLSGFGQMRSLQREYSSRGVVHRAHRG